MEQQMDDKLDSLLEHAKEDIAGAQDLEQLASVKLKYLGKKQGELTVLLKQVSQLDPSLRPAMGKAVNVAKKSLNELLNAQEVDLQQQQLALQLEQQKIDVTLPGRGHDVGSLHPVTRMTLLATRILETMGFSVEDGPEIEDEFHNFEALNIPEHHPARDMHDTFYFPNRLLLRTHTSSVQIRVMQEQSPPLRIITPGRVYRSDSDHTHTPMFHQLEGLVVDESCTFADLKGLIQGFLNTLFGRELTLRFRPSFFPFTEPSAEVDIQHEIIDRVTGLPTGEMGWMEVLGCGMVHPNVLQNVNIDPERYTGYAFGVGLDRLAMLRYGIADLRTLFSNDLRFLSQF
jgi:phenylalanyl-tRNA synthetase alpha chain